MNWKPPTMRRFTVTRTELNRMTKYELFDWYRMHINDEMYAMLWRGGSKKHWINCILGENVGLSGVGINEIEIVSLTEEAVV